MSSQNVGKRQIKMLFFDRMKMQLIVNVGVIIFPDFDIEKRFLHKEFLVRLKICYFKNIEKR